ncbi:hypothetical protein HPC38_01780 [Pasteurellaceae bacterium HPA106]|uniref:WG repeat-containing protein n=1 Tax=Spirabiliibacterium pneumoniae TaxID=221400 RepID=UPI001AADC644|nr:WG repeat-containing protein [Spirabiliibacterium pneumoniae]MBE2895606.1 hypothetical protein [Spirabiliibacterium pneumoniae]
MQQRLIWLRLSLLTIILPLKANAFFESNLDKCREYFSTEKYNIAENYCRKVTATSVQDYSDAQEILGRIFLQNKEYKVALIAFKKAIDFSKNGAAFSAFSIAQMYKEGLGVEKNDITAQGYYQKSCKFGYPEGCGQSELLKQKIDEISKAKEKEKKEQADIIKKENDDNIKKEQKEAQSSKEVDNNKKSDELRSVSSGLDDFNKSYSKKSFNQKWGIIDGNGKWIIEPIFDSIEKLKNGNFKVILNRFISEINPVAQTYNPIGVFNTINGKRSLATFHEGLVKYEISGLWGYLDQDFRVAIKNQFAYSANFYEGLAAVKTFDNLWGFIDRKGFLKISSKFNCVYRFQEGLAAVNLGGYDNGSYCEGGKWGFITRDGQWKIQPVLDHASSFKNGKAKITFQGQTGVIDRNGQWVQ